MDFVQMEQIMEKAFRATISQKFQFWMHRSLLNRFWKAMAQNIRWQMEMQENEMDLSDSIRELIADLEDLQTYIDNSDSIQQWEKTYLV